MLNNKIEILFHKIDFVPGNNTIIVATAVAKAIGRFH